MRTTLTLLALLPLAVCAQVNDGPDAPIMSVGYQQGTGFVFTLTNPLGSNNVLEAYAEAILPAEETPDSLWRFQGYVVLQFATTADADDSIAAVVLDPLRTRPVMITDLDDAVQQVAWNMDPTGPDDCQAMTWYLLNQGIASPLYGTMDPFTVQPHNPNTTYCFTALAFGYNPYHMDPECGAPDRLIMSRRSPQGALAAQCVSGNQVGIAETAFAQLTLGPNPATDALRISGLPAGAVQARCTNALGALVYQGTVADGDVLPLAGWANGLYTLQLSEASGEMVVRTFVVGK